MINQHSELATRLLVSTPVNAPDMLSCWCSPPPITSKVLLAVWLNNQAVESLQERGALQTAYQSLSAAVTLMTEVVDHDDTCKTYCHHQKNDDPDEPDALVCSYAYSWVKCSKETLLNQLGEETTNPGYLSFMCLRFLKIEPYSSIHDTSSSQSCPFPFAWAIYYNVGILCTILGTVFGRQMEFSPLAEFLLQHGKSFLDFVLERVENEQPNNRDWATVHLSVLLNQALGDLERRVAQNVVVVGPQGHQEGGEIVTSSSSTAQSDDHLKRTRDYLQAYSKFFAFEELMEFCLCLQPFLSNHSALAA